MMDAIRETIGILSYFIVPLMLAAFPLYGLYKRVPVYETFVEGAKEGFQVAVRIIPYLVAILFAVGMFRASGAMEALTEALRPLLALIGFPAEVFPMALLRPLTGSGSAALVDFVRNVGMGWLAGLLEGASFLYHFREPTRGLIRFENLVYFLSLIAFCLFTTAVVIRSRRS